MARFYAKEQTKPLRRIKKCWEQTRAAKTRFYAKEQKMALRRLEKC
jgi:hypothetical protein